MANGTERDELVRKLASGFARIMESYTVSDDSQTDLMACLDLMAEKTGAPFQWTIDLYQRRALVPHHRTCAIALSAPDPVRADELSDCSDPCGEMDGENVPRPALTANSVHMVVLEPDSGGWTWAVAR
jgi:hypothetical protein